MQGMGKNGRNPESRKKLSSDGSLNVQKPPDSGQTAAPRKSHTGNSVGERTKDLFAGFVRDSTYPMLFSHHKRRQLSDFVESLRSPPESAAQPPPLLAETLALHSLLAVQSASLASSLK
mmetsp:Transcript_7834/g.29324  ORF Transcript_7834/g.29324 Transcript_7834/m.29324 type:complete len:119 (-) Transcript_7834:1853-2209(-)